MVEFLNRYVSITKEGSTYGNTSGGGTEVYGEVDDESFGHRYDLLTRTDMSRAVASKSVTGTEYSEGGINMALQIDDFVGNIFAAFFPDTDYNSDITGGHTFNEPSAAGHTYNSYTIEVGREQKEHIYTGMVANTLSMTASVGEYVMLSADFVGKAESGTNAIQTASFDGDALDALYFSNGNIYFDDGAGTGPAASASVKSFSFDVTLNRDQDNAYSLGNSTYGRAPPSQKREISGTIEFNTVLYGDQALDEPDYDQLIAADGLTYTDADADATISLKLLQESGADYIHVDFYNVRFEAPEASVSGRDTNTMSVGFIGLYDANASGADKAMMISMKGGAAMTSGAY